MRFWLLKARDCHANLRFARNDSLFVRASYRLYFKTVGFWVGLMGICPVRKGVFFKSPILCHAAPPTVSFRRVGILSLPPPVCEALGIIYTISAVLSMENFDFSIFFFLKAGEGRIRAQFYL